MGEVNGETVIKFDVQAAVPPLQPGLLFSFAVRARPTNTLGEHHPAAKRRANAFGDPQGVSASPQGPPASLGVNTPNCGTSCHVMASASVPRGRRRSAGLATRALGSAGCKGFCPIIRPIIHLVVRPIVRPVVHPFVRPVVHPFVRPLSARGWPLAPKPLACSPA